MAATGRRKAAGTESGVQADSPVTLLVAALFTLPDLLYFPAVLVDVGRFRVAFDGPVAAQTAHRRPSGDRLQRCVGWLLTFALVAVVWAGGPSRRAGFARLPVVCGGRT
ncbi:hypothetical protein Ais01nite_62970 [Asanoa ishikariensis]|nr:hypothetical protein Ais01nite_62970 [Asanoa ishikariensis]